MFVCPPLGELSNSVMLGGMSDSTSRAISSTGRHVSAQAFVAIRVQMPARHARGSASYGAGAGFVGSEHQHGDVGRIHAEQHRNVIDRAALRSEPHQLPLTAAS